MYKSGVVHTKAAPSLSDTALAFVDTIKHDSGLFNDEAKKGIGQRRHASKCELTGTDHVYDIKYVPFKKPGSAQDAKLIRAYRSKIGGLMYRHYLTACKCGKHRFDCEIVNNLEEGKE